MISDIFLHLNKSLKKTQNPTTSRAFPHIFSVCTKKFFFDPTLPARDIYNIHSLLQRISRFITKSSLRESRQGVLHLLQLKNQLNPGRRKSNATFKHINESIKVIELWNVKQNFSKSKKKKNQLSHRNKTIWPWVFKFCFLNLSLLPLLQIRLLLFITDKKNGD